MLLKHFLRFSGTDILVFSPSILFTKAVDIIQFCHTYLPVICNLHPGQALDLKSLFEFREFCSETGSFSPYVAVSFACTIAR